MPALRRGGLAATFFPPFALLIACSLAGPAAAEDADSLLARYEAAKARATTQAYELRYQFTVGETLEYQVNHVVDIETTVQGDTQRARTGSASLKRWLIEAATPDEVTLVHSVSDVKMWNRLHAKAPDGTIKEYDTQYDSKSGEKPPQGYEDVAENVDQPLTRVCVDRAGAVLKRQELADHTSVSEALLMPLPAEAMKVGGSWHRDSYVIAEDPQGPRQRVKLRRLYKLESVEEAIAHISVRTQVLTPVHDPRIHMRLVKHLSRGEITFDVAAGRLLSRELKLDEIVIGFSGANSSMRYLCRFREELAD